MSNKPFSLVAPLVLLKSGLLLLSYTANEKSGKKRFSKVTNHNLLCKTVLARAWGDWVVRLRRRLRTTSELSLSLYIYGTLTPSHKSGKK